MGRLALVLILLLSAGQTAHGQEAGKPIAVDLELVIAVDVSASMDAQEFLLQRDGYAAAIRSPEFVREITTGTSGRIALIYVEWSGSLYQKIIVPWRVIDGAAAADAFAATLERAPLNIERGTSISMAINFGAELLRTDGYDGARRSHRCLRRRSEQLRSTRH